MSRRTRREVEALARDFLAVVGTVLAITALGMSFRYESNVNSTVMAQRPPATVALALNPPPGTEERTPEWARDLKGSLVDQDPTLSIQPTDVDELLRDIPNYSDVRRSEFVRPHRPVPYTPATTERLPPSVVTAPVLTPLPPDPVLTLVAAWRDRPPTSRHVPQPRQEPAPTVHIVGLDGVAITDAPPIAPETVAALGPRQVRGATLLQILPRAFGARVKLIDSCGDAALDDLAVAHFASHVRHLQAMTVDPENQQAWLQSEHVYQVVWRYLPTVTRPQLSPRPTPAAPAAEAKPPVSEGKSP